MPVLDSVLRGLSGGCVESEEMWIQDSALSFWMEKMESMWLSKCSRYR